MSDRFYMNQLAAIGTCPGSKTKGRKRMAWTDEKKEQVIEMYEEAGPTPENSIEIVQKIAEEVGEAPNGVRMVLTKAGVYVKKAAGASSTAKAGTEAKAPRVSKADAIAKLVSAIEEAGAEVDEEIVGKLTGKAALYLAEVILKGIDG